MKINESQVNSDLSIIEKAVEDLNYVIDEFAGITNMQNATDFQTEGEDIIKLMQQLQNMVEMDNYSVKKTVNSFTMLDKLSTAIFSGGQKSVEKGLVNGLKSNVAIPQEK
jgi:sulfate adenylyltransferase subunit 1 (EFTu-like GTPase family)